jgi:voltage-gated potassium channel Kch
MSTRMENRLMRFYERATVWRALRLIIGAALVLVIVAGALERIVEPDTFTSLGLAYWWAVVTVTTVGYGDVVPHSVAGRVVAGALMLVGLALIPTLTSVTISVLISKRTRRSDEEDRRQQDESMEALLRIERRLEKIERGLGG